MRYCHAALRNASDDRALMMVLYSTRRDARFFPGAPICDSGSNLAKLAGLGYQYKLGARWRFGGAVALLQSRTYNKGDAFLAPFPILTYDLGGVTFNAMYVPRYGDYNHFAVFGFYLGVPLSKIGLAH